MLVTTFENGRNISKKYCKTEFEAKHQSLLYNHLVYICAKETYF